jgi:hypothetical protein
MPVTPSKEALMGFYAIAGPAQTGFIPPAPLPSAASLRGQVEQLRPELPQSAPSFQAAVLLLAAQQIGQNIDRLARFTGYPREFIARCARRLCDNGVWQDSRTIATWGIDTFDNNAFWADVAVAEGNTCRRIDENGNVEWARAGVWTKSYEYVEQEPRSGISVQYLSSCAQADAAAAVDKSLLNERGASPRTAGKRRHDRLESRILVGCGTAGHMVALSELEPITWTPDGTDGWRAAEHHEYSPESTRLPELFVDAVWLT